MNKKELSVPLDVPGTTWDSSPPTTWIGSMLAAAKHHRIGLHEGCTSTGRLVHPATRYRGAHSTDFVWTRARDLHSTIGVKRRRRTSAGDWSGVATAPGAVAVTTPGAYASRTTFGGLYVNFYFCIKIY